MLIRNLTNHHSWFKENIPAWNLAVRLHMDDRNFQYRKTFGHFFIVIEKSKEIFQPIILEKDAEAS